MPVTLVTQRLVLRPWREADLEPFVAMSADPDVMTYVGAGAPRSATEARASFENVRATWSNNDGDAMPGLFAIERLDDDRFIGFCGLSKPDFLPELGDDFEIGWRLASWAWGQGFATEAATAVLDWSFAPQDDRTGQRPLERVVSVIQLGNERSNRLAERLGMTVERRTIVPAHDRWVDVYQLDAATWNARPACDVD